MYHECTNVCTRYRFYWHSLLLECAKANSSRIAVVRSGEWSAIKNGLPDCTLLYIKHHLNRYTFVHFLLFTADIDGEINATSLCVRTNSTKEIYQNAAHTLLPYIPHQLYTNALELFFVPRLKGSRANRSDAKVDWREVSASSPPGSDRYSARNAMQVVRPRLLGRVQ